jgi:hypothetical protein
MIWKIVFLDFPISGPALADRTTEGRASFVPNGEDQTTDGGQSFRRSPSNLRLNLIAGGSTSPPPPLLICDQVPDRGLSIAKQMSYDVGVWEITFARSP